MTFTAKAGIVKGLLFYYLKNKKEFYLFLFDYCCELFSFSGSYRRFHSINNFFEPMEYAARVKYSIIRQYPYFNEICDESLLFPSGGSQRGDERPDYGYVSRGVFRFFLNIHFSGLRMMSIPGSYCRCRGWWKVISRISLRQSETLEIDRLYGEFS